MTRGNASVMVAALTLASAGPALGDAASAPALDATAEASSQPRGEEPTPANLELRLSLSTFLYRETGVDAPALVDQGAELQNASPVKRTFGDLRLELAADRLTFDGRVRQTGARRFQAGASGGGEYELRTLAYRLGSAKTALTLGRQYIDAVGSTKIDGVALTRWWSKRLGTTVFGGTLPGLGSRSLDTDYARIRNDDGSSGARLVPLAGGLGLAYQTPDYHGDVGVAGVHVAQAVPDATSQEASRVFTTSSGYWRPRSNLDIYHFALLELAGVNRGTLTNGSVGIDVRPVPTLKVSGTIHHVSADLLQIATRNLLTDPDPSTIGVVQNNLEVLRVSQDVVRGGASVALARQRFEVSMSGALHRRPAVAVELADGTGAVMFPEAKSVDTTVSVLDRRSVGGVRASLSASLLVPLGTKAPNRTRGTIARLAVSRLFAEERGQLEVDVAAERLRDTGASDSCMGSLDVLSCYGMSNTTAAQAGVLASWRASREWLLLADAHFGYQDVSSSSVDGVVAWPKVYSVTTFVRMQWQYR